MKYLLTVTLLTFMYTPTKRDYTLKLTVGETYTQTSTATSSIKQSVMDLEQVITITITSELDFTVSEDRGDHYIMDVAYRTIRMSTKMPQGEVSISTDDDSGDPTALMMKQMIDKMFQLEMAKNGRVNAINNMESLFESLFDQVPNLTEAEKKTQTEQMKESYGEASFKGNLEMITAILPLNSVDVGDTWSNITQLQSGFDVMVQNTYTLVSTDDAAVIIERTSQLNTLNDGELVDSNGMQVRYDLSGTLTARYRLDPKTNWVLEGNVTQTMKGEGEILPNPQLPDGITVPMEITNVATIGQ